jgi:hypothetical protein
MESLQDYFSIVRIFQNIIDGHTGLPYYEISMLYTTYNK